MYQSSIEYWINRRKIKSHSFSVILLLFFAFKHFNLLFISLRFLRLIFSNKILCCRWSYSFSKWIEVISWQICQFSYFCRYRRIRNLTLNNESAYSAHRRSAGNLFPVRTLLGNRGGESVYKTSWFTSRAVCKFWKKTTRCLLCQDLMNCRDGSEF